jgi:hypothetical protein
MRIRYDCHRKAHYRWTIYTHFIEPVRDCASGPGGDQKAIFIDAHGLISKTST